MDELVDKIKTEVKNDKIWNNFENILDELYSMINSSDKKNKEKEIYSINQPVHYLFDHVVNENVGTITLTQDKYREKFNLDTMFNLITGNLEIVAASKHATILYQFEYNDRQYIYYSNSGYGSENQICDIKY
jgi:ribosome-associated translation inhibitor RaiA